MNRIADIRHKNGIKQKDLAGQLGWPSPRLSNYETGLRTPSLDISRDIVHALQVLGADCTLDDVFPPKRNRKGQAA
ncbi:helix-turn-helix transcriptional regulator [Halomonas caseinilytica]|uniref:helix-turn-helix transcriptional regulator n=1 Tax=Halomonas caseinilytica TaxID=438744 RepID=UPI0007E5357D